MSVLYVALPVALLLGGSALVACIYCIRSGQYDDLESPSVRILIDDPSSNSQNLPSSK
jgi:cbb3-type cytochrome oxidase maturation protein